MPRISDAILDSGDMFPAMSFNKAGGGQLKLPDDVAGNWGVVLLYRGHW